MPTTSAEWNGLDASDYAYRKECADSVRLNAVWQAAHVKPWPKERTVVLCIYLSLTHDPWLWPRVICSTTLSSSVCTVELGNTEEELTGFDEDLGQNPSWRVQRTADTWLRHVGSWQRECNQHGWLGVTKWSIWPFSSTQPEKQDRNQRASKCLSAPVPTTKGTPVCDRQSTNFLTFLNSIESYSQQTRSTGLWNQTRQRYHFKTTLLETLMQGQPVDGRSFKKQVKNIRCCRWNQVSFFLRQCRSNFSGLGELYVHDWQATL